MTWHFNRQKHTRTLALWCLLLMMGLTSAAAAPADDKKGDAGKTPPIHITADKMVNDNNKRTIEFTGHVRVVQGETTITADRMLLVYKGSGAGDTANGSTAGNVDIIEAHGHVRIEMDNRVAESAKAVYTTKNKQLVLSGPGSRVISGQDVVEGSVITFYRETGNVKIDGDGKNQVKAIIRSDQMGLN